MTEDNLDLKDLIIYLWKNKILIIIITIIFAIFGIIKSSVTIDASLNNEKKIYIAETTFVIGDTEEHIIINTDNCLDNGNIVSTEETQIERTPTILDSDLIETYEQIARSKDLLQEVIEDLNLDVSVESLRNSVTLSQVSDTYLLRVLVQYSDENKVIELTNCIVSKLEKKLNEVYNIHSLGIVDSAKILNSSEIDKVQSDSDESTLAGSSAPIKTGIKYAIFGFFIICGILVILEIFNTSVVNEKQLENATKLKTLVKINKTNYDNKDKFNLLRVNIDGCKTMLVTSPERNDGKTYVATNLARAFARKDKKVVLIDLVKNENELIKKSSGKGLLDYLVSNDKFVEKYVLDTNVKNLGILPIGKKQENISELLDSSKMQEALSTLERLYDVIIIDSQDVLESANTLAVARMAKYTILVVSERKTKLENVVKAKNNIEDIGGSVVGTVLNKIKK